MRGLREAIRLAKGRRAKVRLFHVVDQSAVLAVAEAGVDVTSLMNSLTRKGLALLERTRRSANQAGVDAETGLREAVAERAADAILREAKRWRADLIVLGTHGRRGVYRLILGSDAELVVRGATVPVLLVRGRGT